MKTRELTMNAAALVLLCISTKLILPVGVIPMTFQTLMVLLLGWLLSPRQIVMIFLTYLIAGLCGLPVFANGGGLSYVLQPSFGFLCSFPVAALFLSFQRSRCEGLVSSMIAIILTLGIIYLLGTLYMAVIFHFVMGLKHSVIELLQIAVLPFLLHDLLSGCLSYVIMRRLSCIPVFRRLQTSCISK